MCLSAPGVISCSDDADRGSGEFMVPRDVAWVGFDGSFHDGGRPECLPATGLGEQGPVTVTWVPVQFSGRAWKQVVGVTC